MPDNTGPETEELDDDFTEDLTELDEDDFTELETTDDFTELDVDTTEDFTELDATELDELVAPQEVNCALFLLTPAYCASLSLTHCAVTGE